MRHVGVAGLFMDLRHFGIFSGCANGDCSETDKGHVETVEDCPRLCAQVGEKCLWWSVGDHGGSRLTCHLRKSDNGREPMEHSHAGERYCVPPGTRLQPEVPAAQAASRACTLPMITKCMDNLGECQDLFAVVRFRLLIFICSDRKSLSLGKLFTSIINSEI